MPRTTDAAVKEIIDTKLNTMPFIMTASTFVDAYLGTAGLSERHLAEIERWWAAHLVCVREPRAVQTKLGDTNVKLMEGKWGTGLDATPYGQTVLQLDTSGTLAATTEIIPQRCYVDVF